MHKAAVPQRRPVARNLLVPFWAPHSSRGSSIEVVTLLIPL